MDQLLQELFYDEIDQGRLVFEDFPEYNDLMNQSMSLFPDGDLPVSIRKKGHRQLHLLCPRPAGKAKARTVDQSVEAHTVRLYTPVSSLSRASKARLEISAFLFRLPLTR